MSWNSQSILSHLFFNSPDSWRIVWRRGTGGEGRVGSRLRWSFAHSANKNARFANYFLLLILETPQGKTPYKRNNQAWPVFIKFWRIPQVAILVPLMAVKIQGMSLTQKHEINALMIIAVKEAAYEVAKRKPEKISGSLGFEPWPVWYRCSAPKKWNYICCIIMSAKNAWSV